MNWEYMQPVKIRFGNGALKDLKNEIIKFAGENGILITSPSFVKSGLVHKIVADSEGKIKEVFSGVSPNPDVKECDACAEIMRKRQCDFVIALGGGSVMDCAKAAATICLTNESIVRYLGTGIPVPEEHLPIIAVPTTAGTGSEITCVSVLSDHEKGIKAPINSSGFYPALAIVDPELTYSVPAHMTACTGFDVLCHAIEGYWSVGHQPICDALAVHAAKLVFKYLKAAYDEPNNVEAREKMAEASVVAGLAFTLPKTTSSHACSYPLTNLLGIPHGEACALTIDYFVRVNAEADHGRVKELAEMLGYKDAYEMADAIAELKAYTGISSDLKKFRLTDEKVEQLVQASKHPNLLNNPIEITEEMLREMYELMR